MVEETFRTTLKDPLFLKVVTCTVKRNLNENMFTIEGATTERKIPS